MSNVNANLEILVKNGLIILQGSKNLLAWIVYRIYLDENCIPKLTKKLNESLTQIIN